MSQLRAEYRHIYEVGCSKFNSWRLDRNKVFAGNPHQQVPSDLFQSTVDPAIMQVADAVCRRDLKARWREVSILNGLQLIITGVLQHGHVCAQL